MPRFMRWLIVAVPVGLILLAAAGWLLVQAAGHVPASYQQALAAQPSDLHGNGERFERQALALHNALQSAGPWEVQLTEDEINGWLGKTLPTKFPEALPESVRQPRIALRHGAVELAARCRWHGMWIVVTLTGDAFLTEHPNEIAFRLQRARAGRLPLALNLYREQLSQQAARRGLALRWTEADGVPLALLRMPAAGASRNSRRLTLERLQLGDGMLSISGRTEEAAASEALTADKTARPAGAQPASDTRQR